VGAPPSPQAAAARREGARDGTSGVRTKETWWCASSERVPASDGASGGGAWAGGANGGGESAVEACASAVAPSGGCDLLALLSDDTQLVSADNLTLLEYCSPCM